MWLLFVVYFFGYCFNGTSELGYDQLWLGRPSQVRWGTATSNSPSPSDRPSPSWVYPPVETQTWLAEKSMEITWFHGGFSGTLNENHRTKWRTCLITAGYLYWRWWNMSPKWFGYWGDLWLDLLHLVVLNAVFTSCMRRFPWLIQPARNEGYIANI